MKKSVLYVLAVLLVLISCSKKDNSEIFKEYFEEWGVTVPYQNVSKTKTYKLLQTLIDNIDKNQVSLINFPASFSNYPSVTKFNEYLMNSKEAAALFEREDCISVLISAYINSIKKQVGIKQDWRLCILEKVLTSDMFMSKTNVTEKVQLMVLALKSVHLVSYYDVEYTFKCTDIMISAMLSSNYIPFINDVKPLLCEAQMGVSYFLVTTPDCVPTYYPDYVPNYLEAIPDCVTMAPDQAHDLIIKYAKQFINDNK